jgi:hypothetical protein
MLRSVCSKLCRIVALAAGIAALLGLGYVALYTPFPVYVLDKLNLRPFFLPNIICRNCNNFTYDYIIDNRGACQEDVYLLIIVASYHANVNARQAIRQTWGGNRTYHGKNIKTVFAFGVHNDKNFQMQLRYEQDKYGDIIQGNFSDFYRSLTNKTMMALKWVEKYCSKAEYVLKTDDDAFNMPERWMDYLLNVRGNKHFIGGYCFTIMPDRSPSSKFYTPLSIYPERYYPTYCSGPGYVISQSARRVVVPAAEHVTFLHMEDVFVGGLARIAAGVDYVQIAGVVVSQHELTRCALATWGKNAHNVVPERQEALWAETGGEGGDCTSRNTVLGVMVGVAALLWCCHMLHLCRLR